MNGDLYLGRLFRIPFRLHWSWFLAVFLIAWTLAVGFFPQTLPEYRGAYWALGLVAALGLFLSVLLHELGHAFVARRFGIPVRGIRLFVFGGVAELGSESKKPSHELLVALGGPAVTLLLIVLYGLALAALIASSPAAWNVSEGVLTLQGGSLLIAGSAAVLFYLGVINTLVLVFNMIPAFPLDGGRVLRAVIWGISGNYLTSTRIAGAVGIAFAWLLFVGGFLTAFGGNLLGGVWMFFLGVFLQNAAQSGIAYAQFQQLLGGMRVADMMRRQPMAVEARGTLRDVVEEFFLRHPHKAYPVVQDGRFLGMLTLRALQGIPRDEWDTMRVDQLMAQQEPLPVVSPAEPLVQAVEKLAQSQQSRLPVVENESLVGLLCGRDVMNFMEIRAGLASPHSQSDLSSLPPEASSVPEQRASWTPSRTATRDFRPTGT